MSLSETKNSRLGEILKEKAKNLRAQSGNEELMIGFPATIIFFWGFKLDYILNIQVFVILLIELCLHDIMEGLIQHFPQPRSNREKVFFSFTQKSSHHVSDMVKKEL